MPELNSTFFAKMLRGNGGNFVLFQLLWPAAVFGAVAGSTLWAWSVLLMQLFHGARTGSIRFDLRLVCLGVIIGLLFECALIASGLIRYQLQPVSWLPPVWILLLWAGFAQAFNHSLGWLRGRLWLASIAGGLASVGSMYAGLQFSAASSPAAAHLLFVYGMSWSVLVPLLAWLAAQGRRDIVDQDDGHYV